MTSSAASSQAIDHPKVIPFWERLLSQQELQHSAALEKLLVGCELIAALDGDVELLAA